jgi:GTP cyclohydrolase I
MGKIEELAAHTAAILRLLGEDPQREGLQRTPERVAKAWDFLTHGYGEDPKAILQSAIFDEECRQMVLLKDIDFYSMCEHHMLPFFGQVHVAYIPNGRIVGLSKIPRMVEVFARRLQVQERLTTEIKNCLQEALNPKGVMVMVEASHLCMQMRGVQKMNTRTTTYDYSGIFAEDESRRAEFFKLLGR